MVASLRAVPEPPRDAKPGSGSPAAPQTRVRAVRRKDELPLQTTTEFGPLDESGELSPRCVLASVEHKLFGTEPNVTIGRYRVLRVLGVGGMGVVYEAHDPELDRKVAIKVLHADATESGETASRRLRREAQAMAKLSHPNLVPVFDVGTCQGRVYLAMEHVSGETLREHLERPGSHWTAVVDLFLHAGAGLAAAHDAGIVHRDFKPDNVLLGRDGRPRVLDFGLAYYGDDPAEHDAAADTSTANLDPRNPTLNMRLTRSGAMLGTPAYMAPEQLRGDPVDARSDQFSFCVSLWRALYEKAPFAGPTIPVLADNVLTGNLAAPPRKTRVPRKIQRILARGLSTDPRSRYASMSDLLATLEPARRLRRRQATVATLLGGAVAIAGAAALVVHQPAATGICADGARQVNSVWPSRRSGTLREAFRRAGAAKTFAELHTSMSTSTSRWKQIQQATCQPPLGKPPDFLHERLSCLQARLAELQSFASILAQAPAEFAGRAAAVAEAAQRLAVMERCDDPVALRAAPPPPTSQKTRHDVQRFRVELAAARASYRAGRRQAALDTTEEIRRRAEHMDYPPLRAEVLTLLGKIHTDAQEHALAEQLLTAAVDLAEASGHDRVIVTASTVLARLTGFQRGDLTTARMWARRAASAIAHMGGDDGLMRALHVALSRALMTRGQLDEALSEIELANPYGTDPTPIVRAQHGLVLTLLGRYALARPHAEASMENWDHGHTEAALIVGAMGILSAYEGHDKQAQQHLEACLELVTSGARPQPAYAAICSTYLATVLSRQGKHELALALHRAVLETIETDPVANVALTGQFWNLRGLSYLNENNWTDAETDFHAARKAWIASHGADHYVLARPATGLGYVYLAQGKPDQAREQFEDALRLRDSGQGHAFQIALTLRGLASALVATHGDRKRVATLLDDAITTYARLGAGFHPALERTRAERDGLERKGAHAPSRGPSRGPFRTGGSRP